MKNRLSGTWWLLLVMLMITGLFFLLTSSKMKTLVSKLEPKDKAETAYIMPVKEALDFAKKKDMDTNVAILIHYHKHSGKKRLYLIDLTKKKATDSFLVAHGCGMNPWGADESRDRPAFSNEPESHCSSLGKYRVGKRAYSDWGINVKYLLHGMEPSNSNALKRTIVLHGWGDVADVEVYPMGVPEGWGCPAVSNKTMQVLDEVLKKADKPVLLWAY